MALAQTTSFGQIILDVQNATVTPIVWTPRLCGMTSKGIALKASSNTANVPDCDNPEDPAWDIAGIDGLSATVTLSGVTAVEDEPFWNQWFDTGATQVIRYIKTGVGYRQGPALLTDLSDTAALKSNGNLAQISLTLTSAGAWPWTAGAPV